MQVRLDEAVPPLPILLAGLAAGTVFGLFGAGGSAFATPLLALIGLPGVVAVATPLPAMLPASIAGAHRYLRSGNLDKRIAGLAIAGGIPGTILGALASNVIDGGWLIVLSGVLLAVVGVRVLLPDPAGHAARCEVRRTSTGLVVTLAFSVGILTGLLANGGGFLLVPAFVVLLGLTTGMAAGTSMVAVGVLALPTLFVHWQLGHIDWPVALIFGLGVLPGSLVGSRVAQHIPAEVARRVFGVLLVVFSAWFLVRTLH
ncbi:MAG: sulfite exporter TauE/SafE family protein [Acidimicrobiales bacterium]